MALDRINATALLDGGVTSADLATQTGNVDFADNARIRLGNSQDLQLYHDGSNSFLDDAGTGNVFLRGSSQVIIANMTGEQAAVFNDNGAVTLNYDNAQKLATASTGVSIPAGQSYAIVSDTDVAINRPTTNTLSIKTGNTQRMRIANGGDISFYAANGTTQGLLWDASTQRLGLGTTAPSDILHIKDGSSTNVLIDAPTDNASLTLQCGSSDAGAEGAFIQFIQNTTAKWQLGMNTDNSFRLYNYNTTSEALRVDSSGKTFVTNEGNVSDTNNANLCVNHSVSTRGINLHTTGTSGSDRITFQNDNGTVGTINTSGSSTSYGTSSDYRLKENVEYDFDATTRLKQLKPARFNFIADADKTVDGFIAHEVQNIVPEAITGEKDGMRDEEYQVSAATGDIYTPAVEATYDDDGVELTAAVDEVIHSTDVEQPEELEEGQQWRETTAAVMGTRSVPDYQGIDQGKLVPLLVKSLQEALTKIDEQSLKIGELETRIASLEAN